jgi:DNA-3-methyladenine glycosylase I
VETELQRCPWAGSEKIYQDYHDHEWGIPSHDERHLFEMLNLEGAQAGLSWITILKKRENYRIAFDNFDPEKISRYSEKKVAELLNNPGIVRNKLKVAGTIQNARSYLALREEGRSLDEFLWGFVDGVPKVNAWKSMSEVPAKTAESDAMSKALAKRGFKFIGSTICYAFMQAVGMVNDHLVTCPKYRR